jgi:hypothetical protein|tara:strand:+ start:2727 stop:3392 length:666 start_codon:yes stop_codon:yes gene_type:complete
MNNFKKDKFCVIKSAISKDLALFCYNYFLMQRQVYETCAQHRYISPFETLIGYYAGKNEQVPHTYTHYSNIAFETLMLKLQPKMEQITGLKLSPNYTFSRLYKRGDILERHKDRFSCEISTTLNLGGDSWPIYIEPNPKKGKEINGKYVSNMTKGIKIILKPGDMLVYRGDKLEHWREPFQGETCGQVFLHYNNIKTKEYEKNLFDKRPHLGLPVWFKKEV